MTHHTTTLLQAARAGDRAAFDELFSLAYDELRRAAHQRLSRNAAGETLNTTMLVHEAYVRLVDANRADWQDRAHFLALASRAMRFVLIDHVRSARAGKRGGGAVCIPLDEIELGTDQDQDLLAVNEALDNLAAYSPRLAQVVEHRFFGGLTYDEIAAATGTSVPTVKRDWVRARAWLLDALQSDGPADGDARQ